MIIADANLLLYLYFDSPFTRYARHWADADPDWRVPPIWRYEVANGLLAYIRKDFVDPAVADKAFRELEVRMAEFEEYVDHGVALRVAIRHNIAVYDAYYITLAQELNCRCVTNDQKLCERAIQFTTPLTRID